MGSLKPLPFFSLFLLLVIFSSFFVLTPAAKSGQEYTNLVYKGCSNQGFSDPTGVLTQALSALFGSLIQQSSKSNFFKTSSSGAGAGAGAGAGQGQTTISGLYQCRGDLSGGDCYNCVKKLPQLVDQLCGKVMAARVQLNGCYILYEFSGFPEVSGVEILYKSCSPTNVAGTGFEMRRDTAFTVLENGFASSGNGNGNGNGFYTTSYESVYVLGQCEGDLGSADCGECVKTAVQRAQVECGSSLSGQLFLNKCFITYSYYPNGVPTQSQSQSSSSSSSSSSDGYAASSSSSSSSGSGQSTGKTVAIILGGTAGAGFLIICALFVRGLTKKHDDS
ncbi:Plasmodesmata-located protein 2 [Dionaea muscipula]